MRRSPSIHPYAPRALAILAAALTACAPTGSKTTGNDGAGLPPDLLVCRADATVTANAEIALRTAHNLGTARVPERAGREVHARVHPLGSRVVFARQRTPGDADTADLYTAGITAAEPELRLTDNNVADDRPCWSPSGDAILFVSALAGDRRLWRMAADGSGAGPFLAAGAGTADDEPDWSRATDRVVFTRREPGGLRRLYLVNGDGTGLAPLTAGSTTATAELGQREPTFAPDGRTVAFVDVLAPGVARLFTVDVDTGVPQLLYDPQGEVRMPRHAPTGDRILCAVAQPLAGRAGLRLCELPASGGEALLVEPGEQWLVHGVDVFPAMAAARPAAAPAVVSHGDLEVQVSAGVVTQGGKSLLAAADGQSVALATETFEDHEIAGLNCVFTLPVAAAGDVVAVRATIVAKVSRSDAATTLRTSLHNPVARRFDTVAELPAPGTGLRTLTFVTQSLAHVSLERQVRVTVIGEIGAGARAELQVDQVQLEVTPAAAAAAGR